MDSTHLSLRDTDTPTIPMTHTDTHQTERVKPDGNFWGRFIKPTALSFPGAVYAVDFSPIGASSFPPAA